MAGSGVARMGAREAVPDPPGGGAEQRERLTDLFVAHRLGLVRLAVLLVDDRQTAEDVVQDAFAGMLARGGRLREADAALGYLRTSVVNGCRSTLRRRRTARAYVAPTVVEPEGPEGRAVLAEEHREVLAALQQIGSRQREVLVLRYWSDFSEAQIAETLGISRGAVKSTASRGLDALEKAMAGAGGAGGSSAATGEEGVR